MITYWKRANGNAPELVPALAPDIWAMVVNPTDAELDVFAREHGLERDLLQDAIDPNEVPRVQHEGEVTYFFLRAPSGDVEQMQTVPLLIAIAPTFFVTVSQQPFRWLERFLHGTAPFSTAWRSQLVWRVLLELNNRFNVSITDIAKRVRGNIASNQSVRNEDILRMVAYEGALNDLLTALQPMNTILTNVSAGKHMKLYDEDKDLREDVYFGNNQVLEAARQQLRTAVNMREAYSVIATNNLNRVIKFLTLVTVVLTVPMVVSGLYGMNVRLPFENNPLAFLFVVVGTAAIIIVLLRIFSAKRLL